VKRTSFRVPSMDSRIKRAQKFSEMYMAESVAYEAWHKGYDAAVRDIRKALKARRSTP
jgi:hypothetical protein